MYADELTKLFIDQRLQGHYVSEEWNLLDIVAVDIKPNTRHPQHPYTRIKVFEVKSDHDDSWRFLEQLPSYLWVADEVSLILDEKQKKPKRLPRYVGVIGFNGKTFDDKYIPEDRGYIKNNEFNTLKYVHVAEYALPDKMKHGSSIPNMEFFKGFMRKWFINSILKQKGTKKILPYSDTERALVYYLTSVRNTSNKNHESELTDGIYYSKSKPLTSDQIKKLAIRPLDRFLPNSSLKATPK